MNQNNQKKWKSKEEKNIFSYLADFQSLVPFFTPGNRPLSHPCTVFPRRLKCLVFNSILHLEEATFKGKATIMLPFWNPATSFASPASLHQHPHLYPQMQLLGESDLSWFYFNFIFFFFCGLWAQVRWRIHRVTCDLWLAEEGNRVLEGGAGCRWFMQHSATLR